METNKFTALSENDTMSIASELAKKYPNHLVLLKGELGAGKTVFARGFAKGLGIDCNVSSPSYTLMNEYRKGHKSMFHLDLYRLNCLEEVVDIGLFDILDSKQPCLIEWAERVYELSKLPHLNVEIKRQSVSDNDEQRIITWHWEDSKE
jgi:tRNA threonylcarbamoyladenosine biosynthesis protein TsaE